MQDSAICPYYDHHEDLCDVGCGYISSHDANMIIKFCSCQYQDCQKYRELSDRYGFEEQTKAKTIPVAAPEPIWKSKDLPTMGLFCYGVTASSYALDKLPILSFNLHLLAVIIMVGGIGQISSGLNSLKSSPLRAIAFTGFGLFWLSILALDILPRAGYGTPPGALPMMGYFAMWGVFSLILCQGLEQVSRVCRLVFAMMTAFLLSLALAHAIGNTAFMHGAAAIGVAGSLPAIYYGLLRMGNETLHLFSHGGTGSSRVRS